MPSVGAVGAITSTLRAKNRRSAFFKKDSSSSSYASVSSNLSSVFSSVKGKASAVATAAGSAVRQAKGKLDAVLQSGGASVTDPAAVVTPVIDPAAAVTGAHPQESALCQLEAMGFSREAAECALLHLDRADVEEAAAFLCEQERLMLDPPPVTQAADPELHWALQASLNSVQISAKPKTPWFLQPSTGTWLMPLPVAGDSNIASDRKTDSLQPAPWFLRPSTGTWLAPLPVASEGDSATSDADAEEEAVGDSSADQERVLNSQLESDAPNTLEESIEDGKVVVPIAPSDATLAMNKLSESMELSSPTRAGTIRGGA